MVRNVAVACQGGGSHTAFTAGALARLLPAVGASDDHRLVGLSGTSGGAFSALAAWYGLLADGAGVEDRLHALWAELCADGPVDRTLNAGTVLGSWAVNSGIGAPQVSPYYTPASEYARERLREALERTVDLGALPGLAGPDAPLLAVGTVDVNGGHFEVFEDEEITPDVMLASAALPELFEAVEMDGHYHWDGLFSQNPPVRELMHRTAAEKPHELWVLQINPQTYEGRPRSILEIADRRNELSGNISLNQELQFVEQVNEWVDAGRLPEAEFNHTEIRRLSLDRRLPLSSKLDRSPAFVRRLMADGERSAESLLAREGPGLDPV
jgi:NTE family protein